MSKQYKPPMHAHLYATSTETIQLAAVELLDSLLDRCTIHLLSELTDITRATLYKWINEDLPLEAINKNLACWFILVCETDPRIIMLSERPPTQYQRYAKALTHPKETS